MLMKKNLIKVSDKFTIAAAFGNVHGVYKPGNVKLTPEILKKFPRFCIKKYNLEHNYINFVFHGGSGSSVEEIREAIGYGVIKMNIDTDLQYAYMSGIRNYFSSNNEYLLSQIGNPDGLDSPNKNITIQENGLEGELTFMDRLKKAFKDLNNINTL